MTSSDDEDGATTAVGPPSPPPEELDDFEDAVECPACQLAAMCGGAKCSKHNTKKMRTFNAGAFNAGAFNAGAVTDCPACQLAAMCGGNAKCLQHSKKPSPVVVRDDDDRNDDDDDKSRNDDDTSSKNKVLPLPPRTRIDDEERTSRIVMANACCELEIDLAKAVLSSFDVKSVKINAATRTVIVRHRGAAAPILADLNRANLGARLADVEEEPSSSSSRGGDEKKKKTDWCVFLDYDAFVALSAFVATVVGAAGFYWTKRTVFEALLSLVYFVGFFDAARRVLKRLVRVATLGPKYLVLKPDLNALAALASSCAYWTGNPAEAAFVVAIFALAEQIEGAVIGRVGRILDVSVGDSDDYSFGSLKEEGHFDERQKHQGGYSPGDLVEVRAGERVPCDGVVVEGTVWLDEAKVSGESIPKMKKVGADVRRGTIAVDGYARVECSTSVDKESPLTALKEAVAEAQTTTSPTVDFGNSVAALFGPSAFLTALLVFAVPVLFFQGKADVWLRNALAVAVAACPCAFALAAPAPTAAAIAAAAKKNILVKSAAALDACRDATVFAFDKTGTLTAGRCAVAGERWLRPDLSSKNWGDDGDKKKNEILRLAAAVEAKSTHPVAAAVVRRVVGHAADSRVTLSDLAVSHFRVLDAGVEARVDGRRVVVRQSDDLDEIVVTVDGVPSVAFTIEDEIRPSAAPAVARLFRGDPPKRKIVVLTGDKEKPARAVVERLTVPASELLHTKPPPRDKKRRDSLLSRAARKMMMTTTKTRSAAAAAKSTTTTKGRRGAPGNRRRTLLPTLAPRRNMPRYAKIENVDEDDDYSEVDVDVHASLTPALKLGWVRAAEKQAETVVFVGDGVNDAAALKAATVGVAFCAAAAATDAADVVVLSDNLEVVPDLVALAHLVRKLAFQNVALAVTIKLAAVLLLLAKPHLGLGLAVLADLVSLLAVVANGLRPLGGAGKKKTPATGSLHHYDRLDADDRDDEAAQGVDLC